MPVKSVDYAIRNLYDPPADGHDELLAVDALVDGADGPGDADAEEHVHRVAARHVADGRVRVFVLHRRHFARERVYNVSNRKQLLIHPLNFPRGVRDARKMRLKETV